MKKIKLFFFLLATVAVASCNNKKEEGEIGTCKACESKTEESFTIKQKIKLDRDSELLREYMKSESFFRISNSKDYELLIDEAYILVFNETGIQMVNVPYDVEGTNSDYRILISFYNPEENSYSDSKIMESQHMNSERAFYILCEDDEILSGIVVDEETNILEVIDGWCDEDPAYAPWTSTSGCFNAAWSACMDDPGCSLNCTLAGPMCPASMLIACYVSVNNGN